MLALALYHQNGRPEAQAAAAKALQRAKAMGRSGDELSSLEQLMELTRHE
jgi:hypothetical protein